MTGDVLATADAVEPGAPLLVPAMRQGRRLANPLVLDAVREYARAELTRLPVPLRALTQASESYPVTVAESLRLLAAEVDKGIHSAA